MQANRTLDEIQVTISYSRAILVAVTSECSLIEDLTFVVI